MSQVQASNHALHEAHDNLRTKLQLADTFPGDSLHNAEDSNGTGVEALRSATPLPSLANFLDTMGYGRRVDMAHEDMCF